MNTHKHPKLITIISVSYKSGEHIARLFENLNMKAKNKKYIKYLVVDNTNGKDQQLKTTLPENYHRLTTQ